MSGGRGGRQPDIGWTYGRPIPDNRFGSICNLCGHVLRSGGVTRLKEHLAGGYRNVVDCPKCPQDVREQMRTILKKNVKTKDERHAREREIREELGRPPYAGEDDVVDLDNDDDPEYRRAIQESIRDQWERDQDRRWDTSRPRFEGSIHERGGGSGAGGSGARESVKGGSGEGSRRGGIWGMGRSSSMRVPDLPSDPRMYKEAGGTQKKIKEMFSGGDVRKKVEKFIAKFFIYDQIPANAAASPHFKNMISEVQRGGEGVQPPTPAQIMGKYLDDEHAEMKTYVDSYRQSWEMYGCTVMCDGWTGPTKMLIINFMVYSRGRAVFLKSIDASSKIKDFNYIYKLMHNVMQDVGRRNIVQFVTDNGSAFVKAGKDIQSKYHMYWTPCAAHCIDLMLEAIGDRPSVKTVITDARLITNFVYNHSWLLAAMRERCGGDIVRPGATRFATNYIALSSLLKHKQGLRELFASHDYVEWKKRLTKVTYRIEELVLGNSFWDKVRGVVGIIEPIYVVLRMVDNETNPSMGSLYPSIQLMKEAIMVKAPNAYKWVHAIIDDRWERTLSHPLHQAGKYLYGFFFSICNNK
ncbi:uncharacterized protein LOC131237418 [Magnolia sinica]|uniref:uncharacterized protein LOC131237418 n=1 Tax=Magnolia sinica TaxID=86752 RepID=UPI002658ED42|nr:uncharacterized protein LOC131237418 [Magnolia sinica]XP_058091146.1 uncharacterized protein LOC131237418 [Magnolia sinica]